MSRMAHIMLKVSYSSLERAVASPLSLIRRCNGGFTRLPVSIQRSMRLYSSAKEELSAFPRLRTAYESYEQTAAPRVTHQSFPGLPGSLRSDSTSFTTALVVTLGLSAGVLIYYQSTKAARAVPKEVKDLCTRARELSDTGAHLSAALQYEKAAQYLKATSGDPIVMLEVLLHLGDAQMEAKQYAKCLDTFQAAERLCNSMEATLKGVALKANDIDRKHVVVLDRLASVCDKMERHTASSKHSESAVSIAKQRFGDVLKLADAYSPEDSLVIDVKKRHILADIAGIYFNATHMRLARLKDEEVSLELLSQCVQEAAQALLIISIAHTAVLQEVYTVVHTHSFGTTNSSIASAIRERHSCVQQDSTHAANKVHRALLRRDCLRRQAALYPLSQTLAQLQGLKTQQASKLYDELETLASLESAAINLLEEVVRLQTTHEGMTNAHLASTPVSESVIASSTTP